MKTNEMNKMKIHSRYKILKSGQRLQQTEDDENGWREKSFA
jgi:hypothetical protein